MCGALVNWRGYWLLAVIEDPLLAAVVFEAGVVAEEDGAGNANVVAGMGVYVGAATTVSMCCEVELQAVVGFHVPAFHALLRTEKESHPFRKLTEKWD